MKTAIVYESKHHGNTKKLLDAIAEGREVTLIDASRWTDYDLSGFDLVGFASGVYYQKFGGAVLNFAEKNLPRFKKVFFLYTCGVKRDGYTAAIRKIAEDKGADIKGAYGCLGFDTFGPFMLVGGIAKGRPNEEDVSGAVKFFEEVCR